MFVKIFCRLHCFIFRLSKGRIGGHIRGVDVLILNSIGRKTGKIRSVPLGYIVEDGMYITSAFAAGAPHHPAWYHNLKHHPDVTIELKDGQKIRIIAEEAQGENRERLWQRLKDTIDYPEEGYAKVQRTIPVMILRRQS